MKPHNGTTVIYQQHELTQAEIDRDNARNAAIARNKGKAVLEPKVMTEMVHFGHLASDAQKGLFDRLLTDIEKLDSEVYRTAHGWWFGQGDNAGVRETITKASVSKAINRMKERIASARDKARIAQRENAADRSVAEAKMHRDSAILGSMRVSPESARAWQQQAPRDKFTDVPNGYYAVNTDDGELAFYRVSTFQSGDRKVQVQASDVLHNMRGRKAADGVLAKIRKVTAPVAGKLYADRIGNCWRCGRTLTDAESRARGIGPVCINK